MNKTVWAAWMLGLGLTLGAFAQTTEVTFVADRASPVFRISSAWIEPAGLSMTSDVAEVVKKMELLTIAPGTITLPNGDYWLNWGGTDEFNRSFTLRLTGEAVKVALQGDPTLAGWSLLAAAFGGLGALAVSPAALHDSLWLGVAAGAGTVSLAGLITWFVTQPRVVTP